MTKEKRCFECGAFRSNDVNCNNCGCCHCDKCEFLRKKKEGAR